MAWYGDMSFWNRDHESWSYMHCEFPAIKDDNCGSVYIFFTAENHWRLQWLGLFLKGHRVDGTCSTWLASSVWVLFLDTFANVGDRVYLQSSNTKKVKMAIPLKAFLYCHTSVFQWWYKHSITYTYIDMFTHTMAWIAILYICTLYIQYLYHNFPSYRWSRLLHYSFHHISGHVFQGIHKESQMVQIMDRFRAQLGRVSYEIEKRNEKRLHDPDMGFQNVHADPKIVECSVAV